MSADTGADDVDKTDEQIRELLQFDRGETVTVRVDLPSALWAAIHDHLKARDTDDLADDASETVAEFVERQASIALSMQTGGPGEWDRFTSDVEIDAETWRTIRLRALASIQTGKDPHEAFHETMLDYVQVTPSLVVDGEPKGVADLAPGIEALLDDLDADAGEGNVAGEEATDA